jgi:PTS system fructose-specific IIC component/PTS system nitrogen regulatory IIA component
MITEKAVKDRSFKMRVTLGEVFDTGTILLNLAGTTKDAVFQELVDAIAAVHSECDKAAMLAALWEREKKLSTGVVSGIAIPHAICGGMGITAGAVGISKAGIEYDALDKKPVHVIFMLIMGEGAKENHLHILDQIFELVKTDALALIKDAKSAQEIHAVLSRFI